MRPLSCGRWALHVLYGSWGTGGGASRRAGLVYLEDTSAPARVFALVTEACPGGVLRHSRQLLTGHPLAFPELHFFTLLPNAVLIFPDLALAIFFPYPRTKK